MRKSIVALVLSLVLTAIVLLGQAPTGGQGGGRGGRGGGAPAASGPMLDLANKVAEAINKQDGSALQKLVSPDAVYLDEDGHALPVPVWIMKLTTGAPAKTMTISATHSQMYDAAGWVSFNYALTENFKNAPLTVKGTASLVAKKTPDGEWQITLIHGAMEQHVAGFTQ